jgi:AraC family transcriptional regulator, transcriptional activator FtrA
MRRHRVAALAYDGLCTFEFGCTVELFALDRPELGVPWYEFAVCAGDKGVVRALGGITVAVPNSLSLLEQADTIVIPGWRDAREVPPQALTKRLRRAYDRGARLCSICSGVFVLAAAGILDGKRATTHWRYAELLARQYPRIHVQPNALYVDEEQVLTSAGSAAGLDMLLHLVRKDFGARVANQVARRLVIPPHRQGDQAQFVPRPVCVDERGRLSKLLDWIRAHLSAAHTIESLARRASMSPRTLQREFRATTGESAYAWLVRERIARARELLEQDSVSMARIAAAVGIGSLESLRYHFRRAIGTTPSEYRARFKQKDRPDAGRPSLTGRERLYSQPAARRAGKCSC